MLKHLLGTSVLVFLLLPLVLSCNSTKSEKEISEDYKNIIQKQLEHIIHSIRDNVTLCGGKKLHRNSSQNFTLIAWISNMSCNRLPRNITDQLQTELLNLRRDINASLGCPCTAKQKEKWPESLSSAKKFCRLKRLLMTIQKAYEQHNSAL